MSESKKRGKLGGIALNSETIKLYSIDTTTKSSKLIEVKEYFRDITYEGGWSFEDMAKLGHFLVSIYIGELGTTPGRTSTGKFVEVLGKQIPVKAAIHKAITFPKFSIGSSVRFNCFIKSLFENCGAVLNKNDTVVISEMITQRGMKQYLWKRISVEGSTGVRVSKLALHSVNGVRVGNLSNIKKNRLLAEVGAIAKPNACTIKPKQTKKRLACAD